MNIVGVTACTAGIAHTYIVKEKLEQQPESWDIHAESRPRGALE